MKKYIYLVFIMILLLLNISCKEDLKEELPTIFEGLDFNKSVGELFKSTKPITSVPFIEQLIEAIKKHLDILTSDSTEEYYSILRNKMLNSDLTEFR